MAVSFRAVRLGSSFSFIGLAFAAVFFAVSLTPSLLPRHYSTQGALSGFALAAGYSIGVLAVMLWLYVELPPPSARLERFSKWLTTVGVSLIVSLSLWCGEFDLSFGFLNRAL